MATVVEELVLRIRADDELSAVLRGLRDNLAGLTAPMSQIRDLGQGAFQGARESAQDFTGVLVGLADALIHLGAAFVSEAISNAIAFEDQMYAIRRVAELTESGTQELGNALLDLSVDMRRPTEDMAKAVEEASRMGIVGEELLQFTQLVDAFAIGVGASAETASRALANIRAIFSVTGEDSLTRLSQIASAITKVDALSATTATKIMEFLRRVPAAVSFGLQPEPMIAFAAALTEMGQAGSDAGTRFNSAMMFLTDTKRIKSAATLLGLTVAQFKKAFAKDALDTILKLADGIAKIKDPLDRVGKETELFGKVGLKALNPIIEKSGRIRELMLASAKAAQENTAVWDAFRMRMGSTGAALDRLKNAFYAIGVLLGSLFLPAIAAVADLLIGASKAIIYLLRAVDPLALSLGALGTAMWVLATVQGVGLVGLATLLTNVFPEVIGAVRGLLLIFGNLGALWSTSFFTAMWRILRGLALFAPLALEIAALWYIFKHLGAVLSGLESIVQNVIVAFGGFVEWAARGGEAASGILYAISGVTMQVLGMIKHAGVFILDFIHATIVGVIKLIAQMPGANQAALTQLSADTTATIFDMVAHMEKGWKIISKQGLGVVGEFFMHMDETIEHAQDKMLERFGPGKFKLPKFDASLNLDLSPFQKTLQAMAQGSDASTSAIINGHNKQKNSLNSLAAAHKEKMDFMARMAKINEEQIVGSMHAIAESMKATASAIASLAPLVKEFMDPFAIPSIFGSQIQDRMLRQLDLQENLGYSQLRLNEENIARLREMRALAQGGVRQTIHRIQVEGTSAAFQALVREVVEAIVLRATVEGGDLCCS